MSSATTTLSPIEAAALPVAKGALVVSLHDVAPTTRAVTEKILGELGRHGIHVVSLLVVPDYHHLGKISADREMGLALRDWHAHGHEIVMHGYFHERPRRENEKLSQKVITRFYTQDEGEFYDLSHDEASHRIALGRKEFEAVGLAPRGFIAPAWLLNAEGERAAADAGFDYTTRIGSIRDLHQGKNFVARSLVYSVRSSWRRAASLAFNAAAFLAANQQTLMRLSIHPPDYEHAEIWRQIVRFIDRALPARNLTTYAAWIDEQRAQNQQN